MEIGGHTTRDKGTHDLIPPLPKAAAAELSHVSPYLIDTHKLSAL